jgi:AraC-like DNA-binding protein
MDLTAEERPSDSPFIESVWRSQSDTAEPFISIANSQSSLVITRWQDNVMVTLRGPETQPTPAIGIPGAEYYGVQFRHGAFLPTLPPATLMDRRDLNLPDATPQSFYFNGMTWELPTFDNIEGLIDRLASDGLLAFDYQVSALLNGESARMTPRTAQRRFVQSTGLTHGLIFQIERARYAATLLKAGTSVIDTIFQAGYFDQAHMIKSFKRFLGLTPGQIADPNRDESLSLLYNTASFVQVTVSEQGGSHEKIDRNRIHYAGWPLRSAGEMVVPVPDERNDGHQARRA